MRWVRREIEAPAGVLWSLLTDPGSWPSWGPTVRRAEVDGEFETGATGVVTTVVGVRLPFEITACERESMRWAWKVAGVPASDHTVQALGPMRCLVGFGVPWLAAPYLAVCGMALRRLESIAASEGVGV